MKKHYRVNDIAERYGVGRSTIFRWVKEGKFPEPIHVTRQTTLWTEEMLDEYEKGLLEDYAA